MRTLLLGVAAAVAMGMGAARAQSPSNVQAVYDRICTGAAPASEKTCAALRQDVELAAARAAAAQPDAAMMRILTGASWAGLNESDGSGYLYKFEWDPTQRRLRIYRDYPGVTTEGGDVYDLMETGTPGAFTGRRTISSLKMKVAATVVFPTTIRMEYKIGWGAGSMRETYTVKDGGHILWNSEQLKGGQWNPQPSVTLVRVDPAQLPALKQALSVKGEAAVREASIQLQRAEQQKREQRSAFWGSLVQGAVAAIPVLTDPNGGASALSSVPLMREDGSAPNLLETLNGVSAQLQQQNAQGKARLDAMIADGYAQGERQRRAREEADRQASVRLHAERQQRDRDLATQVIGQGRQQIQQSLAQARANGDKALEQRALQALQTNEAYAREKGVAAEIRQYAGAGKLGQTPIGALPAPNVVRTTRPAPGPAAETQRFGKGELGCHDHALSESPFQCDRDGDKPGARPGPGRGAGGGTQVASGGGTGPRPAPGVPPGGGQPGVQYETRQESVTLCELTGPQAQYGNWRCTGSTQWSLVNFQHPNWQVELLMTCAGNGPVRDLGTVGVYRAFGCSRALGPRNAGDIPGSHGITYVAGRMTFRCRTDRTECVS